MVDWKEEILLVCESVYFIELSMCRPETASYGRILRWRHCHWWRGQPQPARPLHPGIRCRYTCVDIDIRYIFGLGSSIRYICVDIHKWYRYLSRSSTRWTTSSLARLTAGWTLASRTQPRWWRRHPPRLPCWRPPPWSWSSWRVSPHSVPWCHSYSSVAESSDKQHLPYRRSSVPLITCHTVSYRTLVYPKIYWNFLKNIF